MRGFRSDGLYFAFVRVLSLSSFFVVFILLLLFVLLLLEVRHRRKSENIITTVITHPLRCNYPYYHPSLHVLILTFSFFFLLRSHFLPTPSTFYEGPRCSRCPRLISGETLQPRKPYNRLGSDPNPLSITALGWPRLMR